MLELRNINIVKDGFGLVADLCVGFGKIVAILGPSGGGKSTLLNLIAGFEEGNSGQVIWSGSDLTGVPPGSRPITILFQNHNLFPHLSLSDNVALGLRPDLRMSGAERAKVADALARVGLEGLEKRRPGEVSGGQQSRAALARVFVQDRPLLLLDEPFSALGPALKSEMLGLVRELAEERKLTVLMITHDPDDAKEIADEVIVLAGGKAEVPAPTKDVLTNPPPALQDYLGS